MRRFAFVLALLAAIVLPSPISTAASPENQTESHTLWLPLAGAIPPCWIRDYGYDYGQDRFGENLHAVTARVDPYHAQWEPGTTGPMVNVQFEIYAEAEGQSLLRTDEMYGAFGYHYLFRWSAPGELEQGEFYYLRVRARCQGVNTQWTPLAEFEAFREEEQTFKP